MGVCTKKDLSLIDAPKFLKSSRAIQDIYLDGQSVKYVCRNSTLLVPDEFDKDSNFAIDIICSNGMFHVPENWPPIECVSDTTCKKFPQPPTHTELVRVDRKKKMRLQDKAYFVCRSSEMVIKPNGTNMFSATCSEAALSRIEWPNCTYDPMCNEIPIPSNESLLVRATENTRVKLGEYVKYECKNKEKYFATPDEVSISFYCNDI